MWKQGVILLMFTLVLALSNVLEAAFFDDFEDGDYTDNPTWTIGSTRQPYPSVGVDPVRPNNLVAQTNIDSTSLITVLETPQPWLGFDYKEEYFAQSLISNSIVQLQSPGYTIFWKTYFNGANKLSGFFVEEMGTGIKHEHAITAIPNDEWWVLHISHNINTNLMIVDYSLLDGTVLTEVSFEPSVDLGSISDIESVAIVGGLLAPQYFDNITLVPEPCTLSLLALGGLSLIKRRSRR